MRIDPLFPRDPLPPRIIPNKQLSDFSLVPAQTESDLRYLVTMAAQCGCVSIIVSALKIPKQLSPRSQRVMKEWIALYRYLGEQDPRLNSRNFYRLPHVYQHEELIAPILDEASSHGIKVEHCKANLVEAKAPKRRCQG